MVPSASAAEICGGNLTASDCSGWTAFFDGANGTSWKCCSERNEPCQYNSHILCADGHITFINLEDQKVSGTIAEGIGQLSKLFYLALTTNKVQGTIPASVGDLDQLQFLSIEGNLMSGSIPPSIGQLGELTELYMAANDLSGTVLPSLGQLSQLGALYLSWNRLTGPVPALPFGNYTGGNCGLDDSAHCREPRCNHFACPLPENSSDCKYFDSPGVHCANSSSSSSSTSDTVTVVA